jgi:15-cis-phytoene synthase
MAADRVETSERSAGERRFQNVGRPEPVPFSEQFGYTASNSDGRALAGPHSRGFSHGGGNGEHPVFPALAEVVARHRIPHEYLFAVIDGVRDDLDPTGFETFDDLSRYCYHVAGAVGLCCIHVWGFRDERAIERAIDCGMAFQLTNILRDLGEDAGMGRIYLPREDLQRFDYTEHDLAAHCRDERFHRLMRFQVDRTKEYYRRAEELFDYLEPAGKPIYAAMLRIYGGLLAKIERRDYDVFSRRIRLPRWRKLLIALGAVVRYRWMGRML